MGHRRDTWSASINPKVENSSLLQRMKESFSTKPKVGTSSPATSTVFWPEDLLPNLVPHARIMAYGYEAKVVDVFKSVSENSLYAISRDLISDLQLCRTVTEEVNPYSSSVA